LRGGIACYSYAISYLHRLLSPARKEAGRFGKDPSRVVVTRSPRGENPHLLLSAKDGAHGEVVSWEVAVSAEPANNIGVGSTRAHHPNAAQSEQGGEHWSLVGVAFGAVTGTIISILIQPLVDLLPGKLFENFLDVFVEHILSLALPILFALFASRIRRIDQFLHRYLAGAGLLISFLLAFSVWSYAGGPVRLLPVGAAALTMVVTWFFLLFCGGAVQLGLAQITGKQKEEYEKKREADAQDIAAKAIAEGDPDIATEIFATNAAGAVGKALASGCLQFVLFWFNIAAIFAVGTLDAHVLFRLSLVWSLLAAIIIAAATTRVLTLSEEFGERYSGSVPLSDKYKGIQPKREDRGAQR
jgi:hypothetical protein